MSREEWARDMMEVTPYVFVYGTLKRGYGNNSLLRAAEFIGEDTTREGWLLGNVGVPYAFPPAVVPDTYKNLLHPIRGEVYKLTAISQAIQLDYLEGYRPDIEGAHYFRRVIEPENLNEPCWIYTSEHFGRAHTCSACELNDQGEWVWSRD